MANGFSMETGRLLIRDFVPEDASALHEYASDPEVTRFMLWGPNTEQETHDFLGRVWRMQQEMPRVSYELAVVRKEDGKVIGGCGIHAEGSNGEIGYCFSRTVWQQGFASEAATEMLKFGFGELGLHRIYATCRPGNTGSYKVMEKIGMQREGLLREHMFSKGQWCNSFLYSIVDHEYRNLGM